MNEARLSHIRKKLGLLMHELWKLGRGMVTRQPLMLGSVYEAKKKCGKLTCVCVRDGLLHTSDVMSWKEDGKAFHRNLSKEEADKYGALTQRGRDFKVLKKRMTEIQVQILDLMEEAKEARRERPN